MFRGPGFVMEKYSKASTLMRDGISLEKMKTLLTDLTELTVFLHKATDGPVVKNLPLNAGDPG